MWYNFISQRPIDLFGHNVDMFPTGLFLEPRLVAFPNLQSPAMVMGCECGSNVGVGLRVSNFMEVFGDNHRCYFVGLVFGRVNRMSSPNRWL